MRARFASVVIERRRWGASTIARASSNDLLIETTDELSLALPGEFRCHTGPARLSHSLPQGGIPGERPHRAGQLLHDAIRLAGGEFEAGRSGHLSPWPTE